MANVAYATTTDLAVYLKKAAPITQEASNLAVFLQVASRVIDQKCGQYFYSEGPFTRYFNGSGDRMVDTEQHPFFGKIGTIGAASRGAVSLTFTQHPIYGGPVPAIGDVYQLDLGANAEAVTVSAVAGTGPYTLTVPATSFAHAAGTQASTIKLQLGYYENQPLASWTLNLAGDGLTPGSNFWLWPANRRNAESTATTTATRPWYGFDIAHIPVSGTSFLPGTIPGYKTVGITAMWGWPAVPDLIKDLTCKLAVRIWQSREAGFMQELGSTDTGLVKMLQHFDPIDEMTLIASDFVWTAL